MVEAAARAGARAAQHVILRLPYAVAPLFEQWLTSNFPDRKEKVLNRLRAMREGKLSESAFGKRMRGEGIFAEQVHALFDVACRKYGLAQELPEPSAASFRRVVPGQGELGLE